MREGPVSYGNVRASSTSMKQGASHAVFDRRQYTWVMLLEVRPLENVMAKRTDYVKSNLEYQAARLWTVT